MLTKKVKGYTTISSDGSSEIVINKSRFIGYAHNVDNPEKATEIIKEISKKYYDASHNCYAYITENYSKYSDDGEPSGTAGLPILDCIKKSGLVNCLVVVTRYFGGTKLGAGGLVRAYSACASACLLAADKVTLKEAVNISFALPYELYQAVINKVSPLIRLDNTLFEQEITVSAVTLCSNVPQVTEIVKSLTKGKVDVKLGEQVLVDM